VNRAVQHGQTGTPVDKTVILAVIALASFLSALMGSSINVALPSIGRDFAVDAITLSWIATAYLLAVAIVLVPVGKLADIYGRQRLFLYGTVGWGLVSLLCGLATSAPILIGLRALQGMAGAMVGATSVAIVTSAYPPGERGRALGITVSATYSGLAMGPFIGGIMTQQLGWRSIFLLNAAVGAVMVAVIISKMKLERTGAQGQRLDLAGSVIFGLTLLAIMYGFTVLPAPLGVGLILAGVLGMAVFVWWEDRVPNPVLDIDLFRHNVVFAMSNLAALINYAASFAIGFLLSLYLQYVRGLDPQTAGLVLLTQPAVMALFSPLAGRLSDRIEPRLVASAGMAVVMAGLIALSFLTDASGLLFIIVALVVVGFGFALFSSPNTHAVMGSVQKQHLGVASATLSLMRSVGMALSMGVATVLISIYVGDVQITPANHAAFTDAFRLAFIIFPIMCLIGVFASLARGKLHTGDRTGGSQGLNQQAKDVSCYPKGSGS
jgi:EmrB/QacA subfamily drug resistance transporter